MYRGVVCTVIMELQAVFWILEPWGPSIVSKSDAYGVIELFL